MTQETSFRNPGHGDSLGALKESLQFSADYKQEQASLSPLVAQNNEDRWWLNRLICWSKVLKFQAMFHGSRIWLHEMEVQNAQLNWNFR